MALPHRHGDDKGYDDSCHGDKAMMDEFAMDGVLNDGAHDGGGRGEDIVIDPQGGAPPQQDKAAESQDAPEGAGHGWCVRWIPEDGWRNFMSIADQFCAAQLFENGEELLHGAGMLRGA